MEAPVLWTAEQHALIGAMGFSVYAHVDAQPWPAAVAAPTFENLAHERSGAQPPQSSVERAMLPSAAAPVPRTASPAYLDASRRDALPSARQAPSAPTIATASATTRPAPVRRTRGGLLAAMPDRLMLALLRASKLNPADPATQTLMAAWPLDTLRADAAAKRALWPQLRALRKQRKER